MDRPWSKLKWLAARLILLTLVLQGNSPASAAPVHAVVHLRPGNPPAAPTGYVYMVNGVLPIAPPLRDPRVDAVLILEPTGDSATQVVLPRPSVPSPVVDVRIVGARFLPEIIGISAGTQVVFRNEDRLPITLQAPTAAELFSATPLPAGGRLAVTPPGPGELAVRSLEYPHMQATLVVTNGLASRLDFSPLGEVGETKLDLPAGTYVARLYFLHQYVVTQQVTVPAQGTEFLLNAAWPTQKPADSALTTDPLRGGRR